MKKRLSLLLSVVILFALVAGACSAAPEASGDGSAATAPEASGEKKIKQDVVVAIRQDFQSLDPCGSYSGVDMAIRYCLYDSLLKLDENMQIVPGLAESYEWVDGTTLRLTLREGVKFHNGDTMTAEDVMFSLQRAQGSSFSGGNLNSVNFEKSSIVDEKTIELVLNEVYAPLLSSLADPYSANITSKKYVEENGGDISNCPMGTGPFKFVAHHAGDRIEMETNAEYWDGPAQFKTLTFRIITDNNTRAIEVESGGVDVACRVAASDVLRMKDEDSVVVVPTYTTSIGFLSANCVKAPFDNKLVRQAVMYAIDRTAINQTVYRGINPNMESVLAHTVAAYSDELPKYERDVEKAKALLAEAGLANGFDCSLNVAEDNSLVTMAEMIKNQLAEVGINVSINVYDAATLNSKQHAGDFDLAYGTWGTSNGDPDSSTYPCFHSSRKDSSGYFYANPEVDKWLEAGRSALTDEERNAAYKEVQLILNEDMPWIYIHDLVEFDAISKNVEGYVSTPLMFVDYSNVVVYE